MQSTTCVCLTASLRLIGASSTQSFPVGALGLALSTLCVWLCFTNLKTKCCSLTQAQGGFMHPCLLWTPVRMNMQTAYVGSRQSNRWSYSLAQDGLCADFQTYVNKRGPSRLQRLSKRGLFKLHIHTYSVFNAIWRSSDHPGQMLVPGVYNIHAEELSFLVSFGTRKIAIQLISIIFLIKFWLFLLILLSSKSQQVLLQWKHQMCSFYKKVSLNYCLSRSVWGWTQMQVNTRSSGKNKNAFSY